MHLIFESSFDLSISESTNEERPDNIPQEVWDMRKMLENPTPNFETAVGDLISSGVDADALVRLIDYMQSIQDYHIEEKSSEKVSKPVINICGHLYTLKFNQYSVEQLFPVNFSYKVLLFSVIFGFSCVYLPLSLSDQFYNGEKWWLSIICSFSIFSILKPPEIDPYFTTKPDSWSCLSRPVNVTIICAFWRVTIDIMNKNEVIQLPFYNYQIDSQKVCLYIFDICRYSLLLLPLLIIIGFAGHPVSTINTILEGSCRYFFGQNGTKNVYHSIIQILRGSISVLCCWPILNYKKNEIMLNLSIAIATLLGCIPIYFDRKKMKNIIVSFMYPVLVAAMSFLSSYFLCFLLNSKESKTKDIILYFSCAWFVIFDILFPFMNSCQRYFIFHMKVLISLPFVIYIRNLSQIIVGPIFLSACLFDTSLHPLLIALIIVHATQKYNTEPHVFAFSVFLTTLTLPYDYELSQDYSANLLISLLIAAKVEIFLPQLIYILRSRDFYMKWWHKKLKNYEFLITLYMPFMFYIPFFDFVYKFPCLFWSFFSGSSFTAIGGYSLYSISAPPRCFSYFDWPHKNDLIEKLPFKNIDSNNNIVEKTIYTSFTKSLSEHFASIARSGRIGLVNSGDFYLFLNGNKIALVHVISQEPSVSRIQVRGLSTNQMSIYTTYEIYKLQQYDGKYCYFPNFNNALSATYSPCDIRSQNIQFKMFDVDQKSIQRIVSNIEPKKAYELFLASFAYTVAKKKKYLSECQSIVFNDNDNNDNDEFTITITNKMQTILSKVIQNSNKLNEDDDHYILSEDELNVAVHVWIAISLAFFGSERSYLKKKMLVDSFNGHFSFPKDNEWIYSFPNIIKKIIKPSIQLGCGCMYITSTNNGPNFDSNDEVDVDELVCFLHRMKKYTVFSNIESKLFVKTYDQMKVKNIISIKTINNKDKLLHFRLCKQNWSVFQMKHEYIRALWSNDSKNNLFFEIQTSENRYSSKYNVPYVKNVLSQLNDAPFGKPAYISDIVDSYVNPFSQDKYDI